MILGLGSNGRGVLVANTDYSPATGRFTTEDPAKDGLNYYTYCNNNPIRYYDPTGESWEEVGNMLKQIGQILLGLTPLGMTGCGTPSGVQPIPSVATLPIPSPTPSASLAPIPSLAPSPTPSYVGNYADFLDALGFMESSNNYGAISASGSYLGRYQLGSDALIDAGLLDSGGKWTTIAEGFDVSSNQTFLSSPEAQEYAIRAYHQGRWQSILNWELDSQIGALFTGSLAGTSISVPVTASGLLAAGHLVGTKDLAIMFQTGIIPIDGNGTAATTYMSNYGGYDLTDLHKWKK